MKIKKFLNSVINGDMEPILKYSHGFTNKKHYNYYQEKNDDGIENWVTKKRE